MSPGHRHLLERLGELEAEQKATRREIDTIYRVMARTAEANGLAIVPADEAAAIPSPPAEPALAEVLTFPERRAL
jgi:flagellar motility protein MotE (MotC chaperone)